MDEIAGSLSGVLFGAKRIYSLVQNLSKKGAQKRNIALRLGSWFLGPSWVEMNMFSCQKGVIWRYFGMVVKYLSGWKWYTFSSQKCDSGVF